MNYFFSNLKHLRSLHSLSQLALAEKLGIKKANVGSWEEGRAYPPIDTIISIANLFSLTIDDLLTKDISHVEYIPENISEPSATYTQLNKLAKKENPPGRCQQCIDKERIIEQQQQVINTQAGYIESLKENIELLKAISPVDTGQKRKTGT